MTIEELQEALLQEQEKNKVLQAQYDESIAKNKELEDNNKMLMEHNNKLFMRVSNPVKEDTDEADEDEDDEDKLISDIQKLMKERRN